MKLTDEPVQEAENFGNTMAEMARRISGIGCAPIDLYKLVDTDFIDCKVLALQLKYAFPHDLFDSNFKALSIDDIIRTLNTKLWSLKDQGLWITSEVKKLDMEGCPTVIKLAIKNLAESSKRVQIGGSGMSIRSFFPAVGCL